MSIASELAAWLRLLASPGIGRGSARELLTAFGSPEALFDADPGELIAISGKAAASLLRTPEGFEALLAATDAWLAQGEGRAIVTLADPAYPAALLETADPPLMLYLQGRIELLQAPSLSVVGSRNTTPQGELNARAFSAHLSRAGLTIVSGLALGIDGAAHEGGLAGIGSTIAVVGTGLDRVYPRHHLALARRIAAEGLLVSEFPIGTSPLPGNFPQRNRIIAGLSLGTLVVEAAVKSGSLITARQANEMGREVFAIPGSIHLPQSHGCHALIRQGAKLVERAEDVLEELVGQWAGPLKSSLASALSSTAGADDAADGSADGGGTEPTGDADLPDPVLTALGADPTTLDTLIDRTGTPAALLGARLLELELDGLLTRLPGGLFQRRFAA